MIFIVFEGPDGAGKSTQIELVASALDACGFRVIKTREPFSEEVRAQARQLTPADALKVFVADRARHCDALRQMCVGRENTVVLCDRYAFSTLVYQTLARPNTGTALDVRDVFRAHERAPHLLIPDLQVVLLAATDTLAERVCTRSPGEPYALTGSADTVGHAYASFVPILKNASTYVERVIAGDRIEVVDAGRPRQQVTDTLFRVVINTIVDVLRERSRDRPLS